VTIPAAPRAEHHIASVNRALVHLFEVHSAVVNLERALVAKGFIAR